MNTLKITLPGAVTDPSKFKKINELQIPCKVLNAGQVARTQVHNSANPSDRTLSLLNTNSYFTNQAGTTNLGKTQTMTSGSYSTFIKLVDDFVLSFADKFNILQISSGVFFTDSLNTTASLDVIPILTTKELKYMPQLTAIYLSYLEGDIEDLIGLSNINRLHVSLAIASPEVFKNKLRGDISKFFPVKPSMTVGISLPFQKDVVGDISGVELANLIDLSIRDTNVTGDIGTVNFSKSSYNNIGLANTNVYGQLPNLREKTFNSLALSGSLIEAEVSRIPSQLTYVSGFKGLKLTGDLANVKDSIYFLSNSNSEPSPPLRNARANLSTTFYSGGNTTRQYILALENVTIKTGVDDFLIWMSTLELAPDIPSNYWFRTLSIIGARTAASDSAVSLLASKGVTVAFKAAH